MRLETIQLFAVLCESVLDEKRKEGQPPSSTMDIIKTYPGGKQVAQFLHSKQGLGHEQSFKQTGKVSWNEIKEFTQGSWVLLKYSNGIGAIKQTGGRYTVAASTGGAVETGEFERGGPSPSDPNYPNVLTFLKNTIGNGPQQVWVGGDTGYAKKTRQSRAELQKSITAGKQYDVDKLLEKFKPYWLKAITLAKGDVKGIVANMIKNDAFAKAQKKLNLLAHLDRFEYELNNPETQNTRSYGTRNVQDSMRSVLKRALAYSAHHFYPDQANTNEAEAIKQLLIDLNKGDMKKMGVILGFFRQAVLHGGE